MVDLNFDWSFIVQVHRFASLSLIFPPSCAICTISLCLHGAKRHREQSLFAKVLFCCFLRSVFVLFCMNHHRYLSFKANVKSANWILLSSFIYFSLVEILLYSLHQTLPSKNRLSIFFVSISININIIYSPFDELQFKIQRFSIEIYPVCSLTACASMCSNFVYRKASKKQSKKNSSKCMIYAT